MIVAGGLAMALILAAGAPTPPGPWMQGPWILTCRLPAEAEQQSAPNAKRVFRIGRRLFQEWQPEEKQFGPNLCQAFSCVGSKERLQGMISSNTLSLTISLDLATNRATWRTVGASGLRATSGPCSVQPEAAPGKAASPPPQAPPGG